MTALIVPSRRNFLSTTGKAGLSAAAVAEPTLVSADLNPLIVVDGAPVAVDALVEVRS